MHHGWGRRGRAEQLIPWRPADRDRECWPATLFFWIFCLIHAPQPAWDSATHKGHLSFKWLSLEMPSQHTKQFRLSAAPTPHFLSLDLLLLDDAYVHSCDKILGTVNALRKKCLLGLMVSKVAILGSLAMLLWAYGSAHHCESCLGVESLA